ncbi:MAG: Na+/H+ antiporter NhaA [Steroidobacteraceae bacterium]
MENASTPQPRRPLLADRAISAFTRFARIEAASGILLLIAAAVALVWANSPLAQSYEALWHTPLSIGLGHWVFSRPLHFWINDGLMTLFFLVVGMEIRREIHDGALATLRQAAMPLVAAMGGVVAPALIYLSLNAPAAQMRGWAVPTATDIAFAVGVLALLGRSVPVNVRIFLLALAIIDDIIAVLIIAFFYSGGLDVMGLPVAALGLITTLLFQRAGIVSAFPYCIPGALVWTGLFLSGAHPALAGVVLGLMTPVLRPRNRDLAAPVTRVQQALHPWAAFVIMPLFALANAGVTISGTDLTAASSVAVLAGVALALVAGKPLGIFTASWLMVRLGLCRLPEGVAWSGILLIGLLGGIGFTMSVFIAMLAFEEAALLAAAKLGILLGSVAAALLGLAWGWMLARRGAARAR